MSFLLVLAGPGVHAQETFKVGEFTFAAPAGWEKISTTPGLRKAQFRIPGRARSPDGVVIFYHFGSGKGGSPEANINRWRNHFVKRSARTAATISTLRPGVILFQGTGTLDGGNGVRLSGYGLTAAILQSEAGDVFIRFTGPAPLMKNHLRDFKSLLLSPFGP